MPHLDYKSMLIAAQQIHVAVAPEAPVLTVADASGNEDTAISLAGKISATVDGGETITYTISGIPAGASLNQGTLNQDGSYTLSPSDLSGLTKIGRASCRESV